MKRPDAFILTILGLVLLLSGIYYAAGSCLNYFESNPALQTRLVRQQKLFSLVQRIQNLEKINAGAGAEETSRAPASIPDKSLEFEVDSRLEGAALAKAFYDESKKLCYEMNREADCLTSIDKVVTHFPESVWAGESLVILTDFYYRTHRQKEAREVVAILKQEFKNSKNIQDEVRILEKAIK